MVDLDLGRSWKDTRSATADRRSCISAITAEIDRSLDCIIEGSAAKGNANNAWKVCGPAIVRCGRRLGSLPARQILTNSASGTFKGLAFSRKVETYCVKV